MPNRNIKYLSEVGKTIVVYAKFFRCCVPKIAKSARYVTELFKKKLIWHFLDTVY